MPVPIERVRTCSALLGDGIDELWHTVGALVAEARASGELDTRRTEQARAWMWSEVTDTLLDDLRQDAAVRAQIESLEADVSRGRMSPRGGARRVLSTVSAPVTGPRAFDDLTGRGRVGRLRALARDALAEYDLACVRVSYVAAGLQHGLSRRRGRRVEVRPAREPEPAYSRRGL